LAEKAGREGSKLSTRSLIDVNVALHGDGRSGIRSHREEAMVHTKANLGKIRIEALHKALLDLSSSHLPPIMTYWVPDVYDFIYTFHPGGAGYYYSSGTSHMIVLNILSLMIAACFSGMSQKLSPTRPRIPANNRHFIAVEAQIIWRLYHHLKRRDHSHRSSLIFGATSLALGVLFIIATILLVTSHILKLNFVTKTVKAIDGGRVCPSGYIENPAYSFAGLCFEENSHSDSWPRAMANLDMALETLFQLMLIMGDSLLVGLWLRPR
jgi:hypothetical protein